MKKTVAIILAIVLMIGNSFVMAESVDLSTMSKEQLLELMAQAELELEKIAVTATPVDGVEYEADDFKYVIYTDDTIEITKYIGDKASVSISTEIDGYEVKRIGDSAFEGCSFIESIALWPDVIEIGTAAFKDCTKLKNFSIPSTVTVINDSVFENCTAMESISIWSEETSIGKAAFKNCTSLKSISISASCSMIGESAFENCTGMQSALFWGGEEIGPSAFKNCTSLTSLSIPRDVMVVGEEAFRGCTALESVIIWGDDVEFGINAFADCTSLDKLPEGAVNVEDTGTVTGEEDMEAVSEENMEGIRPEFKEAMDAYEAFYNEYCEFMKEFNDNPSDLMLLVEYAEMVSKAEEMDEAFEAWDEDELSSEELKYYLDVTNRVLKMMLDAVG